MKLIEVLAAVAMAASFMLVVGAPELVLTALKGDFGPGWTALSALGLIVFVGAAVSLVAGATREG